MEVEDEKNFCYIEGTSLDRQGADEPSDFHETVWYKLRPPKRTNLIFTPFVTARQIDLVRTVLTGKSTLYRNDDTVIVHKEPAPIPKEEISINKQKSSVRFLNKLAVNQID